MRPRLATALLATAITTTAVAIAIAVLATATATATATPAGAAYAASAARPATITRAAHVAFANCKAQHVTLRVTAPDRAFPPTEQVVVTVQLRNAGNTTCGAPLAKGVPQARQRFTVGPCGALPMTVRNAQGVSVYPGGQIFFCPEQTGLRLGPHSTLRALAYWNQVAYVGPGPSPKSHHAPPGTYRLVVDRAVSIPVTLTSG
ncbi:MAG TPA: hypothetical protein VH012_01440 [Acidimicrobiales bacterium]|jgi:hypothetical protein|nr:hypothetical protein [Acidimicrobiales bacterium]